MSAPLRGGPAFPARTFNHTESNALDKFGTLVPPGREANYPGMSTRVYLAGQALSLVAAGTRGPTSNEEIAKAALAIADEIIR